MQSEKDAPAIFESRELTTKEKKNLRRTQPRPCVKEAKGSVINKARDSTEHCQ